MYMRPMRDDRIALALRGNRRPSINHTVQIDADGKRRAVIYSNGWKRPRATTGGTVRTVVNDVIQDLVGSLNPLERAVMAGMLRANGLTERN